LIADVAFDLPLRRSFSYIVPPGMSLARGQRVSAPLQGRQRVGLVVDLREADTAGLKPVQRAVESAPILSGAALAFGRWAAAESLSSLGSTLLSLLPPPPRPGSAEPVAPAELEKVKKQARAQHVYAQDGVFRRAMAMGAFAVVSAPEAFTALPEQIDAVTAADVMRVAASYLSTHNRTVGIYLPPFDSLTSGELAHGLRPAHFWRVEGRGSF